ncbi:MAG: LPS export ABC transporter periplasmic protein LptC [Hyphomicrobiaceae bacterium]|nr:LPS export ABC transporter periplasmic protein LptC [Hyphomicrobiaceae bacterium]
MVKSTDLDAPRRRGEHTGAAGVIDTARIRRAQRHSRLIRVLRLALPAGAIGIAIYYATTLFVASDLGSKIVRTTLPKIVPASLTMSNPRYRGFNKDGGEYELKAARGNPHPKNRNLVLLQTVEANLKSVDGTTTKMTARAANYNIPAEIITLHRNIEITSSSGGWARLKSAQLESKTGVITSTQPVELGNATTKITAKTLKILQKTKVMTLTGNVVANISPPKPAEQKAATPKNDTAEAPLTAAAAPAGNAASQSLARMFTAGKGPIEITADRLDFDDAKKTAVFVGNVNARQGESLLTTPELRIAYAGAPSGGLTGAAAGTAAGTTAGAAKASASGDAARITSIVAAEPVAITQAPATRIIGKTAAFDASTQRATLDGGVTITRAPDTKVTGQTAGFDDIQDVAYVDGGVELSQGSDKRATGDHAEFHTATETAILTGGNVVLTQGSNILRGRKLVVEQKQGRMELTSPPMVGTGPGRISAHFIQPNANKAASAHPAASKSEGAGGLIGMSSFHTDPNAPVDIKADQLELHEHDKVAIFRGDVQVQQGAFAVSTKELNAYYTGTSGISSIAAPGAKTASEAERTQQQPTRLTRLRTPGHVKVTSKNGQSATGDWSEFDMAANTVTLGGDVVLTQGRNVVKGTKLVIDMTTGESVIRTENAGPSATLAEKPGSGWIPRGKTDRPRAVFYPQQLRDAAAKAAARKGGSTTSASPATSGWSSTTSTIGER